jgi:HK97 family phage major capsid protein
LISGAQPNVVALNVNDWAALLKTKSSGSGEYLANPFLSTVSTVWNRNLVPSVAIPAGKSIVGDTSIGATLQIREGANLRISDADADDMTRNRVTLLVEMRASLATWIPAAFTTIS